MWNFIAKVFMTFGVIEFVGSLLFLRGTYWTYLKEGYVVEYIVSFAVQLILALILYFLGDLMLRIYSEERTMKYVFKEIKK